MKPIHAVDPDLHNSYTGARAWKFDVEASAKAAGRDSSLFLGSWIIYQTGQPLAQLQVTRLRDDEPRYVQGATHDISVLFLDPEWGARLDAPNKPLPDVPFVAQFHAKHGDEEALEELVAAVTEMVNGELGASVEWRPRWYAKFGGETYEALLAETKRRNEQRVAEIQAALGLLDDAPKGEVTPGCDCPYCTANRYTQ